MRKLIDLYSHPLNNGIFFSMSKDVELFNVFQSLGILIPNDFHSIDTDYIYNHSGMKTVSTLIETMMKGYVIDDNDNFVKLRDGRIVTWDYFMSEFDKDLINFIIKTKFLSKWKNLIDTLNIEYDVASPYQINVTDDTKENDVSKSIYDGSTKSQNTDNGVTEDNIYGFNSDAAVPSDRSTNDLTSTLDTSRNNTTDNTRDNTVNRNIMRKGNIGNRTVTELIEERREMLKYQIMNEIYSDLDSVLTRSKYF